MLEMEKYLMVHSPISCQIDFIKKSAGKYLPWQYFTMKYYILFIVWAESRKSNCFLA